MSCTSATQRSSAPVERTSSAPGGIYPSTADKRLYLSDTPNRESGNEKNKGILSPESSPETGSRADEDPNGGLSMTEEEIKAMKAENERLKAENGSKEKMLSDSMAAARERDKEALRKAAEGKVTQPQMDGLMALCDSFQDNCSI